MGDPEMRTIKRSTKLWEILVPVYTDSGLRFSQWHHEDWQDKVCDLVGGLTLLKSRKGKWKAKKENNIPVRIACDEDQIWTVMNITRNHYEQDSVMAYLVSETCYFLNTEIDYGTYGC